LQFLFQLKCTQANVVAKVIKYRRVNGALTTQSVNGVRVWTAITVPAKSLPRRANSPDGDAIDARVWQILQASHARQSTLANFLAPIFSQRGAVL
jgi:hypothetical protein